MNLFSPNIAYASLDTFLANTNRLIVNPLIIFLFALAVVYFLYGMLQFFSNQESEEKKTSGKAHMLWGIIGITIMMGVWALLGIVLNTLGIPRSEINPEENKVKLNDYVPPSPNN